MTRTNSKRNISENQIRRDERNKTLAEIATRLSPPFSQEYLAKEIFGFSTRQQLNNLIRKYFGGNK